MPFCKFILNSLLLCGIIINEVIYLTVGERIQAARKKAGMKQSDLAKKLGVAVITIGQYERGKRVPNLGQLQAIARVLNADIVYLISGQTSAEVERGILIQAAAEAQVDGSIRIHVSPEQHEYGELMKKYADGTIADDELHRLGELQAQRPPFKESFGMLKTTLDRMKRCLDPLNEEGQQKVIEHAEAYAQDLAEIPRYRRQEPAEASPASPKDTDTPAAQDAPEGPQEGE